MHVWMSTVETEKRSIWAVGLLLDRKLTCEVETIDVFPTALNTSSLALACPHAMHFERAMFNPSPLHVSVEAAVL